MLPPLVFGLGVLVHLLRHGRRYDVVHTASFPYFSLLAAAASRRRGRFRLVVDWHEVWTRDYWRRVSRGDRGRDRLAGAAARACGFRSGRSASRGCTKRRLRELGLRGELTRLEGQFEGRPPSRRRRPARPVGRVRGSPHPREACSRARARAREGPRASCPICEARSTATALSANVVLQAIETSVSTEAVTAPGFVEADVARVALSRPRSASSCRPGARGTAASSSSRRRAASRSSSSSVRTTRRRSSSRTA